MDKPAKYCTRVDNLPMSLRRHEVCPEMLPDDGRDGQYVKVHDSPAIYIWVWQSTVAASSATDKDFNVFVTPVHSNTILPPAGGDELKAKVDARNLVLCCKTELQEIISICDGSPVDKERLGDAKKKVQSWMDVVDMSLPKPAINIGLIKLIKDLPEFTTYIVKGNYAKINDKNYSKFGSSKEDIVIYKDLIDPSEVAAVLVSPEEDKTDEDLVLLIGLDRCHSWMCH